MSKITPAIPKKKKSAAKRVRPLTRPDAAGIDLGALLHFVAVPPDRDAQPVQSFGTQTADLHKLADWLVACRIKTVAMEATGVYWVPLYQILEDRGLEVCLVNARHAKNVPGRKTDVLDCEWLQYLHSVGLLRASFRPPAAICAVRALVRHSESLVQSGSEHLLRVQKALDQMNVQLHHAVSDISGQTGLAILDAILRGERDPQKLAALRDRRCKKNEAEIATALHGDWRLEHLFTLRQSLAAWRYHQTLLTECEAELKKQLDTLGAQTTAVAPPKAKPNQRCDETLRRHLFQKFGVDLTAVDGLNTQTALVVLSEVGAEVSAFPTAEHFASWLCLCPENSKSGGRQLSVATRTGANRLATALRLAARSLHRSESALGEWFRRLKAKLGSGGAITATAHKLARILWAMIKHRRPFDPARFGNPELRRYRKENALRRAAKELGYVLQPLQAGHVS
jgi:transposase